MKAYIQQFKPGYAANVNFYAAYEGFLQMGFEIVFVNSPADIVTNDDYIVVGAIQFVQQSLQYLNISKPVFDDYPAELQKYLGRNIHTSTINTIDANPALWNVFIKPKGITKAFTGRVVKGPAELVGCAEQFSDTPVWLSEIVEFAAEWRVFVRYGELLDVRPYKGNWRLHFDAQVIENAVKDFATAPAGYALDFGVTKCGRTLLVEANDGYSIGHYGLYFINYAKLLSARWAQLTGQRDVCSF